MRGHRYIVAAACAALGACGSSASADAASSAHLTPSAWHVLQAQERDENITTSSCDALGAGASDEETRGAVGMCVDGAEYGQWEDRLDNQCQSDPSAPACLRDLDGENTDLKAGAAWAGWFTSQLAAGGCQSFFSTLGQVYDGMVSASSKYEADLRAHRPSKQLGSDALSYVGLIFQAAAKISSPVVVRDKLACQPAG